MPRGGVLDGIVHRSAGVTANWKRPASDEAAPEIRAIRWFWRRGACGAASDGVHKPELCPGCDRDKIERHRALRPAWFSADPAADVTNAVQHGALVPLPRPLVATAGAPWVALGNPGIGRFRHGPDGAVMAIRRGAHVCGYAVCLSCGHEVPTGESPPARHSRSTT